MCCIPLVAQSKADVQHALCKAQSDVETSRHAMQASLVLLTTLADVNRGVARELEGQGLHQLVGAVDELAD